VAHDAVASKALGKELVAELLEDPSRASSAKLAAMLAFLKKMVQAPDDLGPADGEALRSAGVGEQAIADALNVAWLFEIYNRLADAFGWRVPSPEEASRAAGFLLTIGYR
jgi:alkylhydroperoxidase family enzyme